jgi:sulfate adenylyltransferase
MDRATYRVVLDEMHLPCGLPWTLPVTLPVPADLAPRLREGDRVALRAPGLLAVLEVEEVFRRDLEIEARGVFGTTDPRHPGVQRLLAESPWLAGGLIWLVDRPPPPFPRRALDPAQTRAMFESAGWRTITAFQTRNPIHRAHEYLHKCALEITDGLLLHPLVGETSDDDVPADARMRAYEILVDLYYPLDRVVLAAFPAAMRYAGPREAVFHAIVRKNYGCTHILIGRDHAGVGGFYDPYAAHGVFASFDPKALEIIPLFFGDAFYCRRCEAMATARSCPHGPEQQVNPNGTWLRSLLRGGHLPPREVMRPEVAAVLLEHLARPQDELSEERVG